MLNEHFIWPETQILSSLTALNIQMTHMIDFLGSGNRVVEFIIVRQVLSVQVEVHVPDS